MCLLPFQIVCNYGRRRTKWFNEKFKLHIKPCYRIVWRVEIKPGSKNPKITKTSKGRMFLSKCAVCKKSRFITKQEGKGLLSNLGSNTRSSKIPLLGEIKKGFVSRLIVNFMPETYLRQPGFRFNACEPFTKNKERIQKLMNRGYNIFIKAS